MWRGGSFSLMARAVAHFDTCERRMWAFDSFEVGVAVVFVVFLCVLMMLFVP